MDAVVQYAIDQGLKAGIEAFEKWRNDFLNNPSIVIAKSKAEKYAGGRMVLENNEGYKNGNRLKCLQKRK